MLHARKVNEEDPQRCVDPDGVRIWRYATPSRNSPVYALGYPASAMRAVLAAVHAARGTRVLHSNFPLQGVPLAFGRLPYVHTFHAPVHRELIPEHQGRYLLPSSLAAAAAGLVRACDSASVRRASSLVVLSEFMRGEAMALGARAERISLIPGGIDTVRFSPGAPVGHPWVGADGPLVFTARRMVPRTGVSELVEAFALVTHRVPDARLVLAGAGPLEDEIRARVRSLGVAQQVAMLGRVSDEELVGWYRAADLVIMPTQELEGFGLTTAEALACGTVVVGTPIGANPEVLRRLDASLITGDASPRPLPPRPSSCCAGLPACASSRRGRGRPFIRSSGGMRLPIAICRSSSDTSRGSPSGRACSLRQGQRVPELDNDLLELLRAPGGGTELVWDGTSLRARDGSASFPVVDGVPILLPADSAFSVAEYLDPRSRDSGIVQRLGSARASGAALVVAQSQRRPKPRAISRPAASAARGGEGARLGGWRRDPRRRDGSPCR